MEKRIEIISNISELNEFINDTNKYLVIIDLDDFLIRGSDTLGSDIWYRSNLEKGRSRKNVIKNMYYVYSVMKYQPIEDDTIEIINSISSRKNVDLIIQTARSIKFYSHTVKHLCDAGLGSLIKPNILSIPHYIYDSNMNVRYMDNVIYCDGNPKDDILEHVLKCLPRLSKTYDTIIFGDDSISNVNDMHNKFMTSKTYKPMNTYAIHYSYMEMTKRKYNDDTLINDDQKMQYLKYVIMCMNGKLKLDYVLTTNVFITISLFWWFIFKFVGLIM